VSLVAALNIVIDAVASVAVLVSAMSAFIWKKDAVASVAVAVSAVSQAKVWEASKESVAVAVSDTSDEKKFPAAAANGACAKAAAPKIMSQSALVVVVPWLPFGWPLPVGIRRHMDDFQGIAG
jgi:hypothetical protein